MPMPILGGLRLKVSLLSALVCLVPSPMAPTMAPVDPERVASAMLSWHSLALVSSTNIQTLWAGYGYVCAITARATSPGASSHLQALGIYPTAASDTYELILKLVSPPHTDATRQDEGHLRKMLSYEVEQYFYSRFAPQLQDRTPVAKCLATTLGMEGKPRADELHGLIATIMTDLRPKFPIAGYRRSQLNPEQVVTALEWLARFHSSSRAWHLEDRAEHVLPPLDEARRRSGAPVQTRLWLNGGYTYLETRRSEYTSLVEDTDSEWSRALCRPLRNSSLSVAEMAADFLKPVGRSFETYIHGDIKSANAAFTPSGDEVAFYDFQYIGLGLGVSDLAKLFTSSIPLQMLYDGDDPIPRELAMTRGEMHLLERYREVLLQGGESEHSYDWDVLVRHWQTALIDWLRFQASWGFWGNTEWLEARAKSILRDQGWLDWLEHSIDRDS